MTAMVPHQSYMTQHPSLFTLINHYVIAFSFALTFTVVVGLLRAMASCSAPVSWLSHINNKPLSIVHVKVVPGATFTKRMCDRCGSQQKGGEVVATSRLMLHWKSDSPQMGWATHKCTWREQAMIEWSRRVISIIACCHSVKLCPLAVWAFWSQHKKYTSLSFACLIHANGQRWTCTWVLNLAAIQYIDGFECYHFCLNRFGLELIIFFWTLSQLLVQFWQVTAGPQVNSGLQPQTRWEPFVAGTMLSCPEPTKERVEPMILSIIAVAITHLTRFTLLLLLRIQRYIWHNHVTTWA